MGGDDASTISGRNFLSSVDDMIKSSFCTLYFIYLFCQTGPHCCAQAFSSCSEQEPRSKVQVLLTTVVLCGASPGVQFSSCDAPAQLPPACGTSGTRIEPVPLHWQAVSNHQTTREVHVVHFKCLTILFHNFNKSGKKKAVNYFLCIIDIDIDNVTLVTYILADRSYFLYIILRWM